MIFRRRLDGHEAMWAFIKAPSDRAARRPSTRALHDACAHTGAMIEHGDTFEKIALSELRRREAWAQPAGRAVYVSAVAPVLSAIMSTAALVVSVLLKAGN